MRRYLYIILLASLTLLSCGDKRGGYDEGDDYAKICTNLSAGDFENCGDFYKTGAANWLIELYAADFSEIVRLEIQTEASATSFVGSYPINDSRKANSAVAGFINDGTPYGCCWVRYGADYKVAEYLLCVGGDLTITQDGKEYEIVLDGTTADGRKIGVLYEGVMEEWSNMAVHSLAHRLAIRVVRQSDMLSPR